MTKVATSLWCLDIRSVETCEKLSLDIVRHLEQRLKVGPALILHSCPTSILPALRKRWLHLCREVEKQQASTLDRTKKRALGVELSRLKNFTFSCCDSRRLTDVVVACPGTDCSLLPKFSTLYVASDASSQDFRRILACAKPNSAVVLYDTLYKCSDTVLPILQEFSQTAA